MLSFQKIKLSYFIILTLLIHAGILISYKSQSTKKLNPSKENLVLSFNLTKKIPEAPKVTKPLIKKPLPQKPVTKPIKKKVAKSITKVPKQASKTKQDSVVTSESNTASLPKVSRAARSNYESLLASWLSKYKTYPSRAKRKRITGEAVIYVKINQDGKLLDYYLKSSTGNELLDSAVVKMIERANPLPEIPKEFKKSVYEFAAPVKFELN